MNYFTVLYKMPAEGLSSWMEKPENERREADDTMKAAWNQWLETHADAVKNTIALGKTTQVSANGIANINNGLMLSSYVEAESAEAAAELFKDHPHLQLPGATIEVMEATQLEKA